MPPAPGPKTSISDYRATRSKRWLYVEWFAGSEHDYELYDMAAITKKLQARTAGVGRLRRPHLPLRA
jgi:hypothetical protein